MPPRCHLIGPLFACLVAGSRFASAADELPEAPTTSAPATLSVPEYKFTLEGYANYAFETDLHDNGGSFSVFRSGSSFTMDRNFSEAQRLRVVVDGEYSHYYFKDLAASPGSDGEDSLDAYAFDVRPSYTQYFSENFGAFGGIVIAGSGMAEADLGDSLSFGAFAGVNYQVAKDFWIGGGLSFITQLEDSPLVVPLLTMNWQITPDLRFSSEGLGVRLSYKLDDHWTVYGRAAYSFRQFRLDSNEIVADGVLSDQSLPVSVGVTYDFGNQLKFSAEAGVVAYRRLEFRDDGGDQVGADEADPAGFLSINLEYSF